MRNVLVAAAVAAVVSAGVSAAMVLALRHDGAGPDRGAGLVDVPNLAGLRPDQARALLEPRGLVLEVGDPVEDPRYRPGTVAEQTPQSLAKVARGSAVRVRLVRERAAGGGGSEGGTAPGSGGGAASVQGGGGASVGVQGAAGVAGGGAPSVAGGGAGGVAGGAVAGVAGGGAPSVAGGGAPGVAGGGAAGVAGGGGPGGATGGGGGAGATPARPRPEAARPGPQATVPRVVGRPLGRAREILVGAGYAVGTIRKGRDEDVEHGHVLRQMPQGGAVAPKGTAVDLVVNDTD